MRIAVTGGSGFIGRYIINQLLADGHELRCWYRPESDRAGLPLSGMDWVAGDLSLPDSAASLVDGCDALVHSALWKPGQRFQGQEGDLAKFAEINVVGSLRLFQAAIDAGVQKTVYLSSCAVHDVILDDRPLDEAHPLWARSHYGAHKAAVEKFVHSLGLGHGMDICALRPTGVYGVAHPVTKSKWYPLVEDVVRGRNVTADGGGKEVHAGDVARAVSLLLSAGNTAAGNTAGQAFNCCDRYVSPFEVATLAREISGSAATIDGQPGTPKHQINTEKLRGLGMAFGGSALLSQTITELVHAATGE